jgi:hypothetical protein
MGQLSSDIGGQKAELLELPRQTFPAMSQLALHFVFILHFLLIKTTVFPGVVK